MKFYNKKGERISLPKMAENFFEKRERPAVSIATGNEALKLLYTLENIGAVDSDVWYFEQAAKNTCSKIYVNYDSLKESFYVDNNRSKYIR